jgi:hypothetical protein
MVRCEKQVGVTKGQVIGSKSQPVEIVIKPLVSETLS